MNGINYLKDRYGADKFTRWTTDSIETEADLNLLFKVLLKFKNKFNKPPIITANFITHNIDYNNYKELSFEPLSVAISKNSGLYKKYIEGINNKILSPQLHGYCHYNTQKLERYYHTKEGNELFKLGFLEGISSLRGHLSEFRSEFSNDSINVNKKIVKAINEFNEVFNTNPVSIIPPDFIFDKRYTKILGLNGIKGIQASNRLVNSNNKRNRKIFFRKSNGLIWIPRNARLDPHPDYRFYSNNCLFHIDRAFKANIPAIIDFHRVNISGTYNPKYRKKSLLELEKMFQAILKKWPEVNFISTEELINLCQI